MYELFVRDLLKNGYKVNRRFADDAEVSDHHAIIPTEEYVELNRFSPSEKETYDLVVRRFLAVLGKPGEYEKTRTHMACKRMDFYASGRTMISDGWRAFYQKSERFDEDEEQDDDQSLPSLVKGQ